MVRELNLDKKYFGEGITILNDTIYQLTWQNKEVLVYSLKDFKKIKEFPINTEGWGITTDGKNLIVSDGSSNLYFYEPSSFRLLRTQGVTDAGALAYNMNELEYIDGYIYANQWQLPYIYKIVRKRTLHQKRKLIERVTGKKSGELLDYGSGTGAFLNEMQVAGWRGTGLEPDNGARKVAKDLYGLLLRDTGELFDLPGRYDIITLWHVLEHVHELHATMAQLKKIAG